VFGSNNSQIATLVERQTRYLMLARVKSKDTQTVIDALIKQAHKLPRRWLCGLWCWWFVAQRTVWSDGVVMLTPLLNEYLGFS